MCAFNERILFFIICASHSKIELRRRGEKEPIFSSSHCAATHSATSVFTLTSLRYEVIFDVVRVNKYFSTKLSEWYLFTIFALSFFTWSISKQELNVFFMHVKSPSYSEKFRVKWAYLATQFRFYHASVIEKAVK